ncbi:hypothetical protein ACH0B5_11095 [Ureibacillus sp. 179-F W5.1 NHS]|uniref:Uncharacterized protein n=1 Tax=Ureibacillus galli TaxID=2762222 RepID=A0ABR8XFT2_9BACL|nr:MULTISPECIES: hypothetical protein [Bacillales]MBD8028072.1 hypothetical protein [Ureibacillus galli]
MGALELLTGIIPLLILFIIYVVPIVFVIWFALTVIKLQKEQIQLLKSISDKLKS